MRITKNFTLDELYASSTAARLHIDNTPSEEIKEKLERLAKEILQPIRDKWGAPIVVTSGYRCPELNKAVGGAKTSQHLAGEAADIKVGGKVENKKLFRVIEAMVRSGKINVGQLIDEYGFSWLHLSLPRDGKQNNQVIHIH